MEQWKDIEGYEGLYQISNLGRVKSLTKNMILKPQKKQKNLLYLKIALSNKGVMKKYYIHRLVAQAFIPNPDNLPQVNHKDENPSNNCAENLEWCTAKYNSNYGTRIKRIVDKQGKSVLCVELNRVFKSAYEAAKWLGKNAQSHINSCCLNKNMVNSGGYVYKCQTAYGYHWQYV